MKNLIAIFLILILIGCNKKNQTIEKESETNTQQSNIINLIKKNQIFDIFSLLESGNLAIDTTFQEGKTLLDLAVEYNNEDLLNRLIEQGASLDHQDEEGNTPLIKSLLLKNEKLALVIIDYRPDLDIINKKGENALYIAISNHFEQVVKVMLNHNISPFMKDNKPITDFIDPSNNLYVLLKKYMLNYSK